MRQLILVRHSQSNANPDLPAHKWGLTQEGARRAAILAQKLAAYWPFALGASPEPKARHTADAIAERFGLEVSEIEGLREHHRYTVKWMDNDDAYRAAVARFFQTPDELVLGEETASEALARFEQGVKTLLDANPKQSCIAVTHGSVITLFMAKHTGVDPVEFWSDLTQPWYVALAVPTFKVQEIVRDIR